MRVIVHAKMNDCDPNSVGQARRSCQLFAERAREVLLVASCYNGRQLRRFGAKFCPYDVGCCIHSGEPPKVAGPLHPNGRYVLKDSVCTDCHGKHAIHQGGEGDFKQ